MSQAQDRIRPMQLRNSGARVMAVRFTYDRPVKWNENIPEDGGTYAILTLETECGLRGVSEATLKPVWTGESVRSIQAALEDTLLPRIASVNLADEHAVSMALRAIPGNMTAKMLIDNACWDLRTQAAGMPLWKYLGGKRTVDLSWTLTRDTPTAMAAEALEMSGRYGFRTFKMKGGQGIAVDAAAVASIRDAVSGNVRIYVDANWHYSPAEGLDFVRAIASEGAVLAEDPWWLEANAHLQHANETLPIPLMVDYFCEGPKDAPMFLDQGMRAFSVKPGRIGLSEAMATTRLCRERGAEVIIGMFAEMEISTLHSLSFASTLGERYPAESSFYMMFTDSPLTQRLPIVDGAITLPDTPGVSSQIDWQALERHAVSVCPKAA